MTEDRVAAEEKSFAYWVKVGAGVSLPVVITLIVLGLLFMIGSSRGWFIS